MKYQETTDRLARSDAVEGGTLAVREILQLGNPELWKSSAAVIDPEECGIRDVAVDLRDTLAAFRKRFGFGRAIAAPQIGVHQRILMVTLSEPVPLINPEIIKASSDMMELWDDCFSFPDIMVRVRRHCSVRVRYVDAEGTPQTIDVEGDLSELLQHEIDHLDGVLAVDRAIDSHSFALRSEVAKHADTRINTRGDSKIAQLS
jgi:peptide deformylase